MKTLKIAVLFILISLFSASPILPNDIRQVKDPISDSYIINCLEMETDTPPDQYNDSATDGDIIFDNSFNEPETKQDKESIRNSEVIIKNLKAKDERWHIIQYKVKSGESTWSIAKKFNTESSLIIQINSLNAKGNLAKNQVILVPSKKGIYYTVKKGDTLSAISEKFNTDIEKIAETNNISGSDIKRGKRIFIPDAVEKEIIVSAKKENKQNKTENRVAASGDKKNRKNSKAEKPEKKTDTSKIVMSWPVRGPITSGFGYRRDPFTGSREKRFHCGLDIGAEIGTPVKAASEGKVIFSGWKGSYGYMVVISHKNNYITVYAHNSKNLVETGEIVTRGQVIALTGNTGAVTGAHLHFEIRKGTVPLNPQRMLKR